MQKLVILDHDRTTKGGHLTYFAGLLDHYTKYLCVLSLQVIDLQLLTYGHQICIVGAPGMLAPSDRFTYGLTYFLRSRVKNPILGQPGGTDRNL